ncbi:hypothetical protein MOR33_004012 [Salmonella enterica]|nr:hypothetical protein [Salmonella enterica]EGL7479702.1 hypothetical protein [Salmonella enterica]EIZ2335028.1 hypothetical protein [Salmonella enterica]HCM1919104.1 hypothetical protein [Salmonella enterica subsp. salamae serovar 28:r:e,n,z15]
MKIEYQTGGEISRLIITSSLFRWCEHRHLVDEILFRVPQLRASEEGFISPTTVLYGPEACVLCAEVIVEEKGYQVREASR